MSNVRSILHQLADQLGIIPGYHDLFGRQHTTSDETRMALIASMGLDGSTEESASESLNELATRRRAVLLREVGLVRASQLASGSMTIPLTSPVGQGGRWSVRVEVSGRTAQPVGGSPASPAMTVVESGGERDEVGAWSAEGTVESGAVEMQVVGDWLTRVPIGYHRLELSVSNGAGEQVGGQTLIVTPDRCRTMAEVMGDRQAVGLCVNLYSVRSERNWGFGDLGDLQSLCRWSAGQGLAFVGVNPLVDLPNRGWGISPYSPISRCFLNPLYLEVAAVPEFVNCNAAKSVMESESFQRELARARGGGLIDYPAVLELKSRVLRLLHGHFLELDRARGTARWRQYEAYMRRCGDRLEHYATYCALNDWMRRAQGDSRAISEWSAEYRTAKAPGVPAFRRDHSDEVDFYRYLQFETDRQLGEVAESAKAAGLTIGLYQDLPLGTSSSGSDVWAEPELFAAESSLGCPPDDYALLGQRWGIPPLSPISLDQGGFLYWAAVVGGALSHSGAIRLDHVMGLMRQFWIPEGMSPADGAYVRFPRDELMSIVALESVRHGAVVIGEDLGTVPEGFGAWLERWGVLSCQVLHFSRNQEGKIPPASSFSRRALLTVGTHDHAPLRGYLEGVDLALRRQVEAIPDDESLAALVAARREYVDRLKERLSEEGMLKTEGVSAHGDIAGDLCAATHEFLGRTPAPMIGLALDDLTGEWEPVNLPGVPPERHPSWSRRMSVKVEELDHHPYVRRALGNSVVPG